MKLVAELGEQTHKRSLVPGGTQYKSRCRRPFPSLSSSEGEPFRRFLDGERHVAERFALQTRVIVPPTFHGIHEVQGFDPPYLHQEILKPLAWLRAAFLWPASERVTPKPSIPTS